MKTSRYLTILGTLLSLAIIFGYVEMLLPSFLPNPSFKIGLSQIPVLLSFYFLGLRSAMSVSTGKVLLSSLLFGYFLTYLFFVNLTGALFSIFFIYLSRKLGFTMLMTSVMSSLGHNLGQFLVIGFTLGWNIAYFYLPLIIVFSIGFGLLIGIVSQIIYKKIENRI